MKKMFKRIYIEILNYCNLSCTFCNKTNKVKRSISRNEFNHILNEIKPYTDYIYLHVQGEPLLHKDLFDLLSDANSQGFNVNLTTNGTLLGNTKILSYLRQINISIQALYYMPNRDKYFNDIIELIKSNKDTYISLRLWGNFESEEIIKYFEEKFNRKVDREKGFRLIDRVFFSFDEEFEWPSLCLNKQDATGTCQGTISHVGILADGTVIPCCLDKDGIIDLGNIYKKPFKDIIDGERFQSIRNGFKNNKVLEELCLRCSYRNRFKK